jgi:hypothetical protein
MAEVLQKRRKTPINQSIHCLVHLSRRQMWAFRNKFVNAVVEVITDICKVSDGARVVDKYLRNIFIPCFRECCVSGWRNIPRTKHTFCCDINTQILALISRIFHLYMETSLLPVKGCKILGLRSALRAFEQGGIFIVPHLL